ncbi:hypothetical protein [Spiroplasma endosymbiont of Panorpa germanica]|uniref:hypothetical protein n=1 Tax=Spiroplasma endosymbiont of Panorpa germanica TaxID=3066314 RepID=UPI0030D2A5F1
MKKLKTHNLIFFWLLTFFISLTSILSLVAYFSLQVIDIKDLPGVDEDFFNGFINQNSKYINYFYFFPNNILMPFSPWVPTTGFYEYYDFFVLLVLPMCLVWFFPVFKIMKSWKKEFRIWGIENIYLFCIPLGFLIFYFFHCITYLNCDLFEIIFNKTLFETFDKTFLIDKIGIDELNAQSKIVIDGLKDLHQSRTDGLIIASTVFGSISLILGTYAITFNLLLAKKIINKSNLENQVEKLEEWK